MRHLILIAFLLISSLFFAQKSTEERTKQFNLEKGIAIQGYDPVAYFTSKKAVKGSSKISAKYSGVTYYFSTEDNKKTFTSNASKYEPQYGGWCAYAMGENGEKVEVDPETFKILDGKLFLFYNAFFNNTLKSWNKNEKNLKLKADANWKNLTEK